MFDIGWGELLVIGVVALIAIGPKELPGVLRMTGQWMGKIRRMASEFQDQFREAMREAEMADLKKQVDEMTSTATSYTNFDPIGSVRREVENLIKDEPVKSPEPTVAPEPTAAPEPSVSGDTPQPAAAAAPQPPPADGRKAGEGA